MSTHKRAALSSYLCLWFGLAACSSQTGDTQGSGGALGSGGANASGAASTASGGLAGAGVGGSTSGSAGGPVGAGGVAAGGAAGTSAQAGSAGSVSMGGTAGQNQAGAAGSAGRGGAAGSAGNSNAGAGGASGAASYNPCPPVGQPCKILPFGDSITDGFTPQPGGYRIELFRAAHAAGKNITFVGGSLNGPLMVDGVTFPRNHEGHSGYTIDNEPNVGRLGISPLVDGPTGVMSLYHPHIVTLAIGTNDINGSIALPTADDRLAALVDRIIANDANVLVVLARITPTGTDATNVNVQAYNAAMPALVQTRAAAGKHVILVDMYSAFTSNPNYKTALLADDLHPNPTGYAVMGQIWYQALQNLLR